MSWSPEITEVTLPVAVNIMERELQTKYQELFKEFEIDKGTGSLKNNPRLKFPTFPYIGSEYVQSKRILVVGLDIGSDEKPDGIQTFEERRNAIEDKLPAGHNPHIAGTYFTALYFLKEELRLRDVWNELKHVQTCQRALKDPVGLPVENPLSYIALTNYYKFVSKNRIPRSGGGNRHHEDKEFEINFLVDEVNIFNPDVVIFQSVTFSRDKEKIELLERLKGMGRSVYVGPHPSYRGKREPDHFVKQILKI